MFLNMLSLSKLALLLFAACITCMCLFFGHFSYFLDEQWYLFKFHFFSPSGK